MTINQHISMFESNPLNSRILVRTLAVSHTESRQVRRFRRRARRQAILYFNLLYFTLLYYIILYTILYYTLLYSTILYYNAYVY